jgi:hypothetical protein
MDVEQAKRLMKTGVADELKTKLAELRKSDPAISTSVLWAKLARTEPELFAYSRRIESGDWPGSSRPVKVHGVDYSPFRR